MALLGEYPLLRLPSLSLLCIVQVALVVCWRMLCRCVALADALPPCRWLEFSSDGCFAGWMLCHLDCVADLRTFGGVVSFSRSSYWLALGWPRLGLEVFSTVLLLLLGVSCGRCVFFVFFSFFSLFLVFCDLVLVKLYLAVLKIVCKLFF